MDAIAQEMTSAYPTSVQVTVPMVVAAVAAEMAAAV